VWYSVPATWRKIVLHLPKADGSPLDIELLRPVAGKNSVRVAFGNLEMHEFRGAASCGFGPRSTVCRQSGRRARRFQIGA
jgi:hypothetical protein